jgi:hypothetical protein
MRLAIGLVVILAACGGDDGGTTQKDAAVDSKAVDAPTDGKTFLDAPAGTAPLTVKNYLAWCSVSVDGMTASAGAQQVVNLAPGTYSLVAHRASASFVVDGNMWHHTDGDSGTGETGVVTKPSATDESTWFSTAMVTVGTSAKCVWVCCPFSTVNHPGCENTIPDQCP